LSNVIAAGFAAAYPPRKESFTGVWWAGRKLPPGPPGRRHVAAADQAAAPSAVKHDGRHDGNFESCICSKASLRFHALHSALSRQKFCAGAKIQK
jgi:hypothetical protein